MKIFLLIVAMISCTVIANLLLKIGAVMGREAGGALWTQLLNWRIVLGLSTFAAAAVFYVIVLRSLPLNVAQSFASAQFIAVILVSSLVLSEPIGPMQWVGIVLITCGIAVVGWSQG
jgi:drug/metabolite transporter (DMT)-like permease